MYAESLIDLASRTGIEISNAQATILARTLVLAQDRVASEGSGANDTQSRVS